MSNEVIHFLRLIRLTVLTLFMVSPTRSCDAERSVRYKDT